MSVLDDLKGKGDRLLWTIASLSSSRMSAYGFVIEAEVLGTTHYRINEQLDNRICPVCEEMHGKRFKVEDVAPFLKRLMHVDDPEQFRTLQPWPKHDKESIAQLRAMDTENLVQSGWHTPPFHPVCRGLLVAEDSMDVNDDAQAMIAKPREETGTVPAATPEPVTKEDFRQAHTLLTAEGNVDAVAQWNAYVARAPEDFMLAQTGLNAEKIALADSVFSEVAFDETGHIMRWSYVGDLVGAEGKVLMDREFDFVEKAVTHKRLALESASPAASEAVRRSLSASVAFYDSIGIEKVLLTAGVGLGAYAWAKYGFVPEQSEWDRLRTEIQDDVLDMDLSERVFNAVAAVYGSPDPKGIWLLADMAIGESLLRDRTWRGSLDLRDPEARDRFDLYFS